MLMKFLSHARIILSDTANAIFKVNAHLIASLVKTDFVPVESLHFIRKTNELQNMG